MTYPSGGYAYEADAIADGVVHYYPMIQLEGENSGQLKDYIGGYTVSIGNSNPQNTIVDSSIVGTSFSNTANGLGTNQNWIESYVDLSRGTTYTDWSVSFWLRPTNASAPVGEHMVIVNMAVNSGFRFYIAYTTNTFYFLDSNGHPIDTLVTPVQNNLYHIVITCDYAAPLFTVYVNTASTTTAYSTELDLYGTTFYIGCNSGAPTDVEFSQIVIDELAIYNRVLTSGEVTTIYNSGVPEDFIQYLQSGRVLVNQTIGFADAVAWNFDLSVTDQLGLNDNFLTALLMLLADAADQTGVTDTTPDDPTIIFLPIVEDNLATADTYDVTSAMSAVASDGVNFVTAFNVDGEAYIGVVMNTQNQAVTEYGNFDFNSMAYLGGNKYYGAKADGIYELDGSDDAGSQIDALLSTHLMNFGSQEWKRVERAYLGLRNDGPMVLKTIVRDDATGERKEYWYELTETSEAARIERIKVGKGLKSHLWQFELHNNEGSDFDLDSLEFVPIVLSRRV